MSEGGAQIDAEQFVNLLRRREGEIAALRRYVEALEFALRDKRSKDAGDAAYRETDKELDTLRYTYGFKSDGRWRGDD